MTSLRTLVLPLALPALLLLGCTAVNSLHLPNLSDAARDAGPPPTATHGTLPQPGSVEAGGSSAPASTGSGSAEATEAQALQAFREIGEAHHAAGYRLGAGDHLTVDVWSRPELSGSLVIGPDGAITLPVVGDLRIAGMYRSDALEAIRAHFARAYTDLVVTMRVDTYDSLRVVVLGQVSSPGELVFSAPPDLLRAIGGAGGVSEPADALSTAQPEVIAAGQSRNWRATILRGREAVLWVDLNSLLRDGDLSLNVPLIAGDVVHVSSEAIAMFYVLGQVASPGIYPMRKGATMVDALAMAGGTTDDADDDGVRLLRPGAGARSDFDYDTYAVGRFELDMPLQAGDVIYVPTSIAGEVGYFLSTIAPLAQLLIFTRATRD